MSRRRVLAALTLTAGLLLPAACSAEPADVEYKTSDVHDCDAGDRRKKEIPDCGRKVGGVYREWSWVAQGKTRPPAGWSPKSESGSASKPAPRSTGKKSTTGGGSKSGTSRTGTSTRRR